MIWHCCWNHIRLTYPTDLNPKAIGPFLPSMEVIPTPDSLPKSSIPALFLYIWWIHSLALSQIIVLTQRAKFVATRCMKPNLANRPNLSTITYEKLFSHYLKIWMMNPLISAFFIEYIIKYNFLSYVPENSRKGNASGERWRGPAKWGEQWQYPPHNLFPS